MNFMESHFWYNKRQRNGILWLFMLLLSIQILLFFVDFTPDEVTSDDEFALIQSKLDSLKGLTNTSSRPQFYPFNPNYLTDFKAYQLGLDPDQIDRLLKFREAGKFVNTEKEFQRVTGINDSLLLLISPYFKFPKWTIKKESINSNLVKAPPITELRDLNKVSANDIENVNIVDQKMAKRIIAYRNLLQGFSENDQLFEVYYLKKETGMKLLEYFKVMEKPAINKLDINSASFKDLLKIPYLDYTLTKRICQYRDQNDFFLNLDEIKKIDSFPLEKFDRIALYLSAE